jgi:hypothetical protein
MTIVGTQISDLGDQVSEKSQTNPQVTENTSKS